MRPWIRSWIFGAFAGVALLFCAVYAPYFAAPFVLVIFVVTLLRSRERAAMGGGALVVTGAWFLYGLRAAVERCAEMNRPPSGTCEIYGVGEQAIAMSLYLLVGVGLTAYAAMRSRRSSSPQPA